MYKLSDPSSPWCRLHQSPLHDWCFVVLCSATSEAATSEAATSDRHSEWAGALTAAVSGTLALLALQGNDPTGRPSRLDRRRLSRTSFQPGRFEGFPDRRRPGPAAAAAAASTPRVLAGRTYTNQTQARDKSRAGNQWLCEERDLLPGHLWRSSDCNWVKGSLRLPATSFGVECEQSELSPCDVNQCSRDVVAGRGALRRETETVDRGEW